MKRICDRFEGFELVELLQLPVEEVVEAFAEQIKDNAEFLQEFLEIGR